MNSELYTLDICDKHNSICLFSDRLIAKGQPVYSADTAPLSFDISQEQYDTLDQKLRNEVLKNGYFDELDETYHVDFNVIRYIRTSQNPNLIQDPTCNEIRLITLEDVRPGVELTLVPRS